MSVYSSRKKLSGILKNFGVAVICLVSCVFMVSEIYATEEGSKIYPALTKKEVGSGVQYKTTIQRETTGELSAEDLHQVTLLTSRVVGHLNQAAEGLLDDDRGGAQAEIDQAQQLVGVVRKMLPVTTVTTVVTDSSGNEVYRETDTVQKDLIPLYRGAVAVEVVEPLVEAKKEQAAVKGVRLSDVDVLHTSLTADLRYLERKLARAKKLLDTPQEALAQLVLAQTNGLTFSVNEADHPLVEAQAALRLAERMVAEGRYDAARDNLRLAQVRLETHRVFIDEQPDGKVKVLQDEIAALLEEVEGEGAAGKIRNFWERVVSWFHKEPGEVQATTAEPAEPTDR